ncbi:MAG: type II toxin-antitoxin system Phd/YefM family antitoxin [Polyangiaceae bacterium]
MKRLSLAEAKAHISELVDWAEHRGERIVILRHGKPAAAIVPVAVAAPPRHRAKRAMDADKSAQSIRDFIEEFSKAEPEVSAVKDLLDGRR